MALLLFFIGLASGGAIATLWWRGHTVGTTTQLAVAEKQRQEQDNQVIDLREGLTRALEERSRLMAELEAERRLTSKQVDAFAEAKEQLIDQFGAMSAEALERNNRTFLDLALSSLDTAQTKARGELDQRAQSVEEMVKPLQDSLKRVDDQLHALEVSRTDAYSSLVEQVKSLGDSQDKLRSETSSLVNALRAPHVRGRWGEMQLRKVVEAAGMVKHCDFSEQVTVVSDDGTYRPDLVVHLPGGKHIVVDAKVPLSSFIEADKAEDSNTQTEHFRAHARQVRSHIDKLSSKAYWKQFENTPDFVVLFVPGDSFMAAACGEDASLFEYAADHQVLLATPMTLIALLQSSAYGWRQDALAENARAICETGRELYDRLCTMGTHVTKVGKHLDKAVEAYNAQVGTLESRVMVSARKLSDLEVSSKELDAPAPVERQTRALQAAELVRLTPVQDQDEEAS